MPPRTQSIELKISDNTQMRAYVARPAGASPSAGLLIFQEAFGINAHMRSVADRFSEQGYLAIAPELFHRSAPPGFEASYDDFPVVMPHYQALTNEGLLADAQACFDWLTAQGVRDIGSVGFCLGGRVSFLANSALPLKAAVSYYGGNIAPSLLSKAADQKAPLLLHWGGLDKHITPPVIASVEEALRASGKEYISSVYSKADHAFNCDARPNYHAESATLAWGSTLAFLKLHLFKS